jgi:aminoglycoside phosphotransferase (APT) family kinase protein
LADRVPSLRVISGADSVAVAEAVRGWLAAQYGDDVALAEAPAAIGDGFDNWIHRVQFSGAVLPASLAGPLIARVHPTADRLELAQREACIQDWCADREYPAPRVLAIIPPDENDGLLVQLIERFPGDTMFAALVGAPWKAFALLDRLAELHAQLHALPTDGWPAPTGSLAERRLALVREVADQLHDDSLLRALAQADRLLPRLEVAQAVACHGDFHPLNVLVEGDRSAVIDWTDAGLGDRHGDVARTALLFRVAAIAASKPSERAALRAAGPVLSRRYLRAYARYAPLTRERLWLWEPLHLLHGWSQVAGVQAGLWENLADDDARTERVRPGLGEWLQARFDKAIERALATQP